MYLHVFFFIVVVVNIQNFLFIRLCNLWLLRNTLKKISRVATDCFPPPKICSVATFPRQRRVAKGCIPEQLSLYPGYNQPDGTQVIKHDKCEPRLFTQWAPGWPGAWAYGLGGPRPRPRTKGLGSQAVPLGQGGSRSRAQVSLGTPVPYSKRKIKTASCKIVGKLILD